MLTGALIHRYDKLEASVLLGLWHEGDKYAEEHLLQRHMGWIRAKVSARLGDKLRCRVQSDDIFQDALLRFLKDGPRVWVSSEVKFRALMALIVERVIGDQYDWFTAKRRDMNREYSGEEALNLDAQPTSEKTPTSAVTQREQRALARLGLELLTAEDKEVYVLRAWDRLPFKDIANRMGITVDATVKRFERAAQRLSRNVQLLRDRTIDPLLSDYLDDELGA